MNIVCLRGKKKWWIIKWAKINGKRLFNNDNFTWVCKREIIIIIGIKKILPKNSKKMMKLFFLYLNNIEIADFVGKLKGEMLEKFKVFYRIFFWKFFENIENAVEKLRENNIKRISGKKKKNFCKFWKY